MEQLLETIELDSEESNELLFKVQVEGIDPSPVKVRLVCENGDVGYMFTGHSTSEPGVVKFNLPVMKDKLKDGSYLSKVEVMIENRYFAPVQFNINFKRQVRVVAEAITRTVVRSEPSIRVSAVPVKVEKQVLEQKTLQPAIIQQKHPVKPQVQSQNTLKERFVARANSREEKKIVTSEDEVHTLARDFVRSQTRR